MRPEPVSLPILPGQRAGSQGSSGPGSRTLVTKEIRLIGSIPQGEPEFSAPRTEILADVRVGDPVHDLPSLLARVVAPDGRGAVFADDEASFSGKDFAPCHVTLWRRILKIEGIVPRPRKPPEAGPCRPEEPTTGTASPACGTWIATISLITRPPPPVRACHSR